MSKKTIFAVTFLLVLLAMNSFGGTPAYANDVQPVQDASTVAKWNIIHAPESAFSMYFTGAGNCIIENGSTLSFSVGNIDEDIEGLLSVGNVSIMTNDTDVSRDLVLGVGIFSVFEPGLFVKAGFTNIEMLNDSAYTAAARVSGNFMNGTMSSTYHNTTVNQIEYEAITFQYEQDTPFTGNPQITTLTYAIATGVLLYANTSYWFGEGFEPYWLEFEFLEIAHEGGYLPPSELYPIIVASVIITLLVVMVVRKRM
jgi:hypothetical protein